MKKVIIALTFLLIIFVYSGCEFKRNEIRNLDPDFRLTHQMQIAIDHYQDEGNVEKLKALIFILNNMEDHFALSNILSRQYDSILTKKSRDWGGLYEYNKQGLVLEELVTLEKKYGSSKQHFTKLRYDKDLINSEYLISNIDHAYDRWKNNDWLQRLTFEEFCNHVLPYRVDHEPLHNWRPEAFTDFNEIVDKKGIDRTTVCSIINDSLKSIFANMMEMKMYPIRLTYDQMHTFRVGICEDETAFATMAMRSVGLPVGIDFVPQWPWRSMGHSWNYLLLDSGKTVPFMGTESNPGIPHFEKEKKGKVYRKTYAKQAKSLAEIEKNHDLIPLVFRSPYLKDVTADYVDTHDIQIEVNSTSKYLYLGVFDNKDWIPIAWTTVRNSIALFKVLIFLIGQVGLK